MFINDIHAKPEEVLDEIMSDLIYDDFDEKVKNAVEEVVKDFESKHHIIISWWTPDFMIHWRRIKEEH